MKLIFLDIDGVMNSMTGSVLYMADMEVSKIELLKKLINLSGAEGIVLTSDRRFSKPYMDQFIEVMDKFEIFLEGTLRYPKEYEEDPDAEPAEDGITEEPVGAAEGSEDGA